MVSYSNKKIIRSPTKGKKKEKKIERKKKGLQRLLSLRNELCHHALCNFEGGNRALMLRTEGHSLKSNLPSHSLFSKSFFTVDSVRIASSLIALFIFSSLVTTLVCISTSCFSEI